MTWRASENNNNIYKINFNRYLEKYTISGEVINGGFVGQLEEALEASGIKIKKFDPEKTRPVISNIGTVSMKKFIEVFRSKLVVRALEFPEVSGVLFGDDESKMIDLLEQYAEEHGKLATNGKLAIEIPDHVKNLTLNMDLSASGRQNVFFTTHEDEIISLVSGENYLRLYGMNEEEATAKARKVFPEYMPRDKVGIVQRSRLGKTEDFFNKYIPPDWKKYNKWKSLPDKLPEDFDKLVKHLFPIKEEREYFFAWLHDSLFSRAFTFLVLCGIPGSGKNTLKTVMRALHGHVNTVDGKKSTLVEKFNSQLSNATMGWFDELSYDMDMENVMKELQNDTISIEQKGVDATRATKIYASIVISNNKPRDNYIAFDARKFVPLVVNNQRLEKSMRPEEIDRMIKKTNDDTSPNYDVAYVAQIAKWVKSHGKSTKWPRLEYRGPMFWRLAHTSMSRWQKKAIMSIYGSEMMNERNGYDFDKKAFLWSRVQEKTQRKNGDRSLQYPPDYTSVKAFFELFRDEKGFKTFKTEDVPGNMMGDFWVKITNRDFKVMTEAQLSLNEQRKAHNGKSKKEKYDL